MVVELRSQPIFNLIRSVTRVLRPFRILIIAVALVWATNSVDSSVQSAFWYILVALIVWDFTRVLAVRNRRQSRDRRNRAPKGQL